MDKAFANTLANAKNGTAFKYHKFNPAVPQEPEEKADELKPGTSTNKSPAPSEDWDNHAGRKNAYGDFTLKFISDNKEAINQRAKEQNVPPIALAMAIGDELQTRKDTPYKFSGVYDRWQDNRAYEKKIEGSQDIGAGNIKSDLAKSIRDEQGWKMNDLQLQKYLISDEGTVHIAAIALKKVKDIMDPHLDKSSMPDYEYDQHLVEGYREGPEIRMNRRAAAEKEARRRLEILENPDNKNTKEARAIWVEPILDNYGTSEYRRTPLVTNQPSDEELYQSALKKAKKGVEKFDAPMKTGVSESRSNFRHHQAKWILENMDKTNYEQTGILVERPLYKSPIKNNF